MSDCQSCLKRPGTIEWRGSFWCTSCFEVEAENRTDQSDWIARVLGTVDQGEFSPPLDAAKIDFEKRAQILREKTVLKERESEVRALKERALSHNQIAERLGVEKATVDTYSRRINDRIERAQATVELLD